MDKDESNRLYAKDKEAWNRWAHKQLANGGALPAHEAQSRADFSGCTFKDGESFEGFIFPSDATFNNATFEGRAVFKDAVFKGRASFTQAAFYKVADFRDARFEKDARFDGSVFEHGPLTLRGSVFNDDASFQAIDGSVPLMLAGTRFASLPDFRFSQFRAPQVDNVEVGSGLTRQWLDQKTLDPRSPLFRLARVANHPDNAAMLRALKAFAIAGHDREREHAFYALEIISRRHWQDRPFGRGASRFWLGHLYELFSGFGRSFVRPAVAVLVLWLFFGWFYWEQQSPWARGLRVKSEISFVSNPPTLGSRVAGWISRIHSLPNESCSKGEGSASSHALFLSTKNMLIGLGGAREEETRQAYQCLYGTERGDAAEQAAMQLSTRAEKAISCYRNLRFLRTKHP